MHPTLHQDYLLAILPLRGLYLVFESAVLSHNHSLTHTTPFRIPHHTTPRTPKPFLLSYLSHQLLLQPPSFPGHKPLTTPYLTPPHLFNHPPSPPMITPLTNHHLIHHHHHPLPAIPLPHLPRLHLIQPSTHSSPNPNLTSPPYPCLSLTFFSYPTYLCHLPYLTFHPPPLLTFQTLVLPPLPRPYAAA
ncbi:hypothetical protein Pcinc_017274 [Petrolisthes cinctipes]|uniref:Uncharacterized protein n=1 Tax=Petrolisthes cinctipes TaxID=88211 RepID=A0AAE1KNX3_PETCI|nr:hypothetical protein Pcinc_017274 [Petrolisthes cinctipes]